MWLSSAARALLWNLAGLFLHYTVNLADRNICGWAIFISDLQLDEYHPNFISNEFLSSKPRHAISSFINEILVSLSLSLSLSPTLPVWIPEENFDIGFSNSKAAPR